MTKRIDFEKVIITNPITNKKHDAVGVIRNGRPVAFLPEWDRLTRALVLPLKEVEYIVNNFTEIMNREPSRDEREFWKAVLDFKRSQG